MELGLNAVRMEQLKPETGARDLRIEAARELLRAAMESGIRTINVPDVLEDPDEILKSALLGGRSFAISVELSGVRRESIREEDVHRFEGRFWSRLELLGVDRAAGIILGHPGDLFVSGGDMIYATMQHLKDEGFVRQIGISVSTGEEIDRYLYHYDFDVMRLPLNVFDQRLLRSGHVAKLKANDVEVQVRSPFFEGVLLAIPACGDAVFETQIASLQDYRTFLEREGLSPLEGALGFLRAQPELDLILVDAPDACELGKIVRAFGADLSISRAYADFAIKDVQNLDRPF